MGDIVRYNDAPTSKRLQSALGLAVAFWVLLIGAEAAMPWSDGPDDHAHHAVATSVAHEFAVVMDHPHLQAVRAAVSPDTFATAVVPRVATTLVALGLAIATVVFGMYAGHTVWATMRAPPRALIADLSGRQLLVRFCIARR